MAYNPNNPNGQATSANSAPVVLASDQSAVPVTDNGTSLTVDGTVAATQSGTWNIGTVSSITNTVTVSGSVTADTELPAAAALADNTSNPTTPILGAACEVYNGATWDRMRAANALDGTEATSHTGVLAVLQPNKRFNPVNLGTAANSTSVVDVNGANSARVAIGTSTTGTFIIEVTADGTNWQAAEVYGTGGDAWFSGQNLTPAVGAVYTVLVGSWRSLRLRTVTTLGATVQHFITLSMSQGVISAIDTGPAPHAIGYSISSKSGEYSTTQTGVALWTPASGRKFVITDFTISTGGTTSGIVTLWQGASADTTYTVGTDPVLFRGEFAPSATAKPGVVKSLNIPFVSTTADHILRVTTSAAMTIYVQVNGYEIV